MGPNQQNPDPNAADQPAPNDGGLQGGDSSAGMPPQQPAAGDGGAPAEPQAPAGGVGAAPAAPEAPAPGQDVSGGTPSLGSDQGMGGGAPDSGAGQPVTPLPQQPAAGDAGQDGDQSQGGMGQGQTGADQDENQTGAAGQQPPAPGEQR